MFMLTTVSWVFALLLAIAGAQKLGGSAAMRALGAGEILIGLGVLVIGGRIPALALAIAYAAFAAFAERQRRRGAGCGCFGARTQASRLHVWVDVAAAGVAGGAAVWPDASLPATVSDDPLTGALTMVLLATAASLLRLLLTEAPELTDAVVRVTPRSDT